MIVLLDKGATIGKLSNLELKFAPHVTRILVESSPLYRLFGDHLNNQTMNYQYEPEGAA